MNKYRIGMKKMNKKPIIVVYHVCILGNWKEILLDQLKTLNNSGLGKVLDKMYVQIVGVLDNTHFQEIKSLFLNYSFSHKISFKYFKAIDLYEFPSIKQVQQIARTSPEARILYFHTKGVSHEEQHGKQYVKNLNQWRKFMEYFNIEKWDDCLHALEKFDACGVDWGKKWKNKPQFFAGNFWWATGKYITTCQLTRNDRFDCEYFIGTGNPKVRNFLNSHESPRLGNFFSQQEISEMTDNPDVWESAMFQFWKFYYDESYFKGL